MLGAINPQILSDGGLQVVSKDDIFETIQVVDSRDLFGIYSPDGKTQLVGGDSGVFANMDAQARETLKEQIKLNSGGMDAIMPFITMSPQEFSSYNQRKQFEDKPKEGEPVAVSINKDNYEEFLPPSKLNAGSSRDPNPELLTWASENMGAWESFVNSLPDKPPMMEDYPEDQRDTTDPEGEYGIDLRFYNKVTKSLKKQLPKIKKMIAKAKDTE